MCKCICVSVTFVALLSLVNSQVQDGSPCRVPNGENGICINIYDCKAVTDILSRNSLTIEHRNYIRSLSCGQKNGRPYVCCLQPVSTRDTNTIQPVQPTRPTEEELLYKEKFLLPPKCGHSNISLPKVVGGVPAKLGDFRWMVALGYRNKQNRNVPKWLCGGTLITYRHVLTAAHCVQNRPDLRKRRKWVHEINMERKEFGEFHTLMPQLRQDKKRFFLYFRMSSENFDEILNLIKEDITKLDTNYREAISAEERLAITLRYLARVGDLDLYADDDGAEPKNIQIINAKIHEQFSNTQYINDIAILTIAESVEGLPGVSPICLPFEDDKRTKSYIGSRPYVAGWGAINFNGPSSSVLQVASIPIVDNSQCEKVYARQSIIDERIICAGYPQGGKDACQGDSGGPLMQGMIVNKGKDIQFYQIGVISYGRRCAEPGIPGAYTRVTQFLNWIGKNIN